MKTCTLNFLVTVQVVTDDPKITPEELMEELQSMKQYIADKIKPAVAGSWLYTFHEENTNVLPL